MNLYLLLKTLHTLSSTTLFSTGLGLTYYVLHAWHSGQLPVIAVTFRHLAIADWLLIATIAAFQPLSDLAMVYVAGWSLIQGWLLRSPGLYVLAGLYWLPVVRLQIRVRDMAEAALREVRPTEPLAYRHMNAWLILGWPAFVAFIVIFYLMVNKSV